MLVLAILSSAAAAAGQRLKIQRDAEKMIATNVKGFKPIVKLACREGDTLDV
jgi:hypothetical protein